MKNNGRVLLKSSKSDAYLSLGHSNSRVLLLRSCGKVRPPMPKVLNVLKEAKRTKESLMFEKLLDSAMVSGYIRRACQGTAQFRRDPGCP